MVNYKNFYFNTEKKRLIVKKCTPSDLNNLGDMDIKEIYIRKLFIKKSEKINNLPITLKLLKIDMIFTYHEQSGEYMWSKSIGHKNTVMNNTKLPHGCVLEFTEDYIKLEKQ